MRQWRALITYRHQLVGRRTKIKNHIRDLLLREGQILARGSRCWNKLGQELLNRLARPLTEVEAAELWRGEFAIVAVGRKLLVRCWAMLRDNRAWDCQPQIT